MDAAKAYIKNTIGLQVEMEPLPEQVKKKLPLYLLEEFIWYKGKIAQKDCVFAEAQNTDNFSIAATAQQVKKAAGILKKPVVLIFQTLEAYQRKRLIDKHTGFVVPEKQLYIPEFLIDLREIYYREKVKHHQLIPMAQVILIWHLLHRKKKLEEKTFKEIAAVLNTNAMAITRAVKNLQDLGLIVIQGEKEKYFQFKHSGKALWEKALEHNLLVNPVIKTVFVDEKPKFTFLLKAGASALPDYTDLNPGKQEHYAIEKTAFYELQKHNDFVNMNEHEGRCVLEVWKYNPLTLAADLSDNLAVVDPLSLYLSVKNSRDERIEIALGQLIEKYLW